MNRTVDGTESVDLWFKAPDGDAQGISDTLSLRDLGWDGEQGDELEEFMENAYKEWVWEQLDGYIKFSEEE